LLLEIEFTALTGNQKFNLQLAFSLLESTQPIVFFTLLLSNSPVEVGVLHGTFVDDGEQVPLGDELTLACRILFELRYQLDLVVRQDIQVLPRLMYVFLRL
jgi:hypothetical protein